MRVALDSNIFMYALAGHQEWGAPAVAILRSMRSGEISGIASVVSLAEVTAQPRVKSPGFGHAAQMFMEGLEGIDYFSVDIEVALCAGRLRAEFGSKLLTPDALHLATAVCQRADIFVTNDKKLLSLRVEGLALQGLGEPIG